VAEQGTKTGSAIKIKIETRVVRPPV
jgi:hypothetical protein